MTEDEIETYTKSLVERRHEGVVVKRMQPVGGTWKPIAHGCHDNVSELVGIDPRYEAVRGWIDLDEIGVLRAHSVVRNSAGELMDVTPLDSQLLQSEGYKFIESNLDEETFRKLVKNLYENPDVKRTLIA